MKFVRQSENTRLTLPPALLAVSGLQMPREPPHPLEVHALDKALVILKGRMTAMELITASRTLHQLSVDLNVHLTQVCGLCQGCENGCPFDNPEEQEVSLPERDERRRQDLRDLPADVREMFRLAGVCLGELDEHLLKEDIVYGK